MAVVEFPMETPGDAAWRRGEAATIAAMGVMNLATARLVDTIGMLIDTEGWGGVGIQSIEHWVTWKAGVCQGRARKLVRIARRRAELPACWGLFEAGQLTEDAMSLIALRVPAVRDAEVAGWAPMFLYSQLSRALRSCPELPDPDPRPKPGPRDPQRYVRMRERPDGSVRGEFELPAADAALLGLGLDTSRDAEFRDRNNLPDDEPLDGVHRGSITLADALVRMAQEATDALDRTLQRSGRAGDRHMVVLHRDLHPDGTLGPAQLGLGSILDANTASFLSCDATILCAVYDNGRLVGFTPTVRAPSRALRRSIERRDQGCAHPLCQARRWLHIHHIRYWENQGPTVAWNLLCLCPVHHRALHNGEFSIEGNPEDGTLRFLDHFGRPIEPPEHGPPPPPGSGGPSPFTPPRGEPLDPRWFGWN